MFGLGNNTAPPVTTGFRSSTGFGGFNIGNGLRSTVGNALRKEFSYTEIFSNLVQFQQTLSVFDWNATDAELRQKYEAYKTAIAGQMGEIVGRGIGSTLAVGLGGAAGVTVPKISSGQLAKRLMEAGSEQAREEIIEEVESAIQGIKGMALNLGAIETYINIRTFIKKKVPTAILEQVYGKQTTYFIKNIWGEPGAEDLILQEELEEKIESITNPQIRSFIEQATEAFFESIIETGFVIAGELDSAFREFQLTRAQNQSNQTRTITLQTVADEPNSERFLISADNYEEAQDEIRSTLQQWRIMQNRDVGQIVAQSAEIFRAYPQLRRLEITFASVKAPPLIEPNGQNAVIVTVKIPNLKKPITWREIKRTCLVYADYAWEDGNFNIVAYLNSKRKIKISAKDEIEGEKAIRELAELTSDRVIRITSNQAVDQLPDLRRDIKKLYPIKAKLINKDRMLDVNNRFEYNASTLQPESITFALWTDNEPDNLPNYLR